MEVLESLEIWNNKNMVKNQMTLSKKSIAKKESIRKVKGKVYEKISN